MEAGCSGSSALWDKRTLPVVMSIRMAEWTESFRSTAADTPGESSTRMSRIVKWSRIRFIIVRSPVSGGRRF